MASLHAQKLNRNIHWQRTPFVVQRSTQPWAVAVRQEPGGEVGPPRRAALSSFGATGTNAHLVLEEYAGERPKRASSRGAVIVPLSAQNEERLRESARRLRVFLQGSLPENPQAESPQPVSEASAAGTPEKEVPALEDIGWTLQVGRREMPARVAFIVESLESLLDKLARFERGEASIEGCCYRKASEREGATFAADEDFGTLLRTWIRKSKLRNIAQMWVGGQSIDWSLLHSNSSPRRLSLPGYPFRRERYWLPDEPAWVRGGVESRLHPLVHRNTSDLQEQRFSSRFEGAEFFLSDHRVRGGACAPGGGLPGDGA